MKILLTTLLLSGLFLFSSSAIMAQQATTPPSRVNVKFNAKYPQYADKANWKQTGEGYTATFTDKGRQTISRFSNEGQWLDTQAQLLEKDWKTPMRQYLNENHKDSRNLKGHIFEDAKGTRYQLDVQAKDGGRYRLNFDQEGNFVNEQPIQD